MLNSGIAQLLDDKTVKSQLLNLERHTARGGKDLSFTPRKRTTM